MRRTFAEHHLRPVTSLDGLWTLRPQDGSGRAYSAWVPGVWERIPALTALRGVADYEREVLVDQPGRYLLRMGAVSHTGRVFWDDELVGFHYHDPFGRAKWSEERQCDILTEQLTALMNNPRLSGVYIWQFADVRVAEEWAMSRPKAQNNKGIVDMFRQPKLSYLTVQKLFGGKEHRE